MTLIRGNRDIRVDFFRGLALWWIFGDHIPGDMLSDWSLHNFAMCDAAEVFVLLAGFGAGLAYGGTMNRQGYVYAAADTLRRAWTLYVAHIFLFVVFAAQVAYSATALDRVSYLEESRLDVLGDAPYRALLEALLLRFQPSLLNILPLYVALLVMFAAVLPLLRWPAVMLGLSFVVYAAVQATGVNFPSWTGEGWYFNPLAWQLLFMIGAILAYAPPAMPRRRRVWDAGALLVLVAGLLTIFVIDTHPRVMALLPAQFVHLVIEEDKTGLHPFRLLSILSLAWLVVRIVPAQADWLRSRFAAPLVLAGQNSLPVFCAGVFLGFMCRLGLEANDGPAMQLAVNLFGGAAMLAVGALAAWYRGKARVQAERGSGALRVAVRTDTG
jgi:hypothetical protein